MTIDPETAQQTTAVTFGLSGVGAGGVLTLIGLLIKGKWFNGTGERRVDAALLKAVCDDTKAIVVTLAKSQEEQARQLVAQTEILRSNSSTLSGILEAVRSNR